MKRRKFLHTGALGLLGLGLPAETLLKSQTSGVRSWLCQLALDLGARWSFAAGQTPGLGEAIRQTDAFLAARGFERSRTGAFFCENNQTCFYPLALRRASAGLTEFLVPVFHRQTDGSWKRLAVLTSYQIEALYRASAHLSGHGASVAELLLPAGAKPASGSTFFTRGGSVYVETRLHNGAARTAIAVRTGESVVYEDNFEAEHTLRSSSKIV